jgi:hypothetical protein
MSSRDFELQDVNLGLELPSGFEPRVRLTVAPRKGRVYGTRLPSRYVTFQLAEVAIKRNLFVAILDRIPRGAMPPP